jgi:hypothetical protein
VIGSPHINTKQPSKKFHVFFSFFSAISALEDETKTLIRNVGNHYLVTRRHIPENLSYTTENTYKLQYRSRFSLWNCSKKRKYEAKSSKIKKKPQCLSKNSVSRAINNRAFEIKKGVLHWMHSKVMESDYCSQT